MPTMSNKPLSFRKWLEDKYYDKNLREVFINYYYRDKNLDVANFIPDLIAMGYDLDDSYTVFMSASYRPISWGNIEYIAYSEKHNKVMSMNDGWTGSVEKWNDFMDPDLMEETLELEETKLYKDYCKSFSEKI